MRSAPSRVRAAQPADIPALMRLKRALAQGENSLHAVRANAADWLRDDFGADAGFTAFVAEDAGNVIGMATCSQRIITGWNGPVIFLQDLFVLALAGHFGPSAGSGDGAGQATTREVTL